MHSLSSADDGLDRLTILDALEAVHCEAGELIRRAGVLHGLVA